VGQGGKKVMSYYQVSDENLQKVEAYFVKRTKETGSNRIEATVIEIAEGSGVALATAHKAIKTLVKEKIITMIKPKSRRFPINYIYTKDIADYDAVKTEQEQIEYLKGLVQQYREELEEMRVKLNESEGQRRIDENNSRNDIEQAIH
jgi:predicted transcriptional regulator